MKNLAREKKILILSIIFFAFLFFTSEISWAITSPFDKALKIVANNDTASAASSTNFDLGSTFTIECFFKLPSGQADSGTPYLFIRGSYWSFFNLAAGANDKTRITIGGITMGSPSIGDAPNTTTLRSSGVTIAAGTWYHVAFVGNSGTLYIFFDGTKVGESTFTGSASANSSTFRIGGDTSAGGSLGNGSGAGVEEFRMASTADYTANFTVPSAAYTDCVTDGEGQGATTLNLYHFNTSAETTDSCGTANTLTLNGTTTTVITLASFTATPVNGKVLIEWETATEEDNAGFNILRSKTKKGKYVKINSSLIAGAGDDVDGEAYSFTDEDVKPGKIYYYKLEDIDIYGKSTLHGPVKVKINYKKKKK